MNINSVKIFGAGSIGNHLANASRILGWKVQVCDISQVALDRMKSEIYPARYGRWDDAIALSTVQEAPKGEFDLICIGTPPDSHVEIARTALDEHPKCLQIEKPLTSPSLNGLQELADQARQLGVKCFVGYDHVVGRAASKAELLLREGVIGEVVALDVEFREHWGGIFKAHPWLKEASDSYLGFWKKGGGASGEHSHALNLWQHFAIVLGQGRIRDVQAMVRYVGNGRALYDDLCCWNLRTEEGLCGRVVQDVVSWPARKCALVQGTEGSLRWVNSYSPENDAVVLDRLGQRTEIMQIQKTRADDFIEELTHIDAALDEKAGMSPIALDRGMETMLAIAAAHKSEKLGRRIKIDYNQGCTPKALKS